MHTYLEELADVAGVEDLRHAGESVRLRGGEISSIRNKASTCATTACTPAHGLVERRQPSTAGWSIRVLDAT